MTNQTPICRSPAAASLGSLLVVVLLSGLLVGLVGLLAPQVSGVDPRVGYVTAFLAVTAMTVFTASLAPTVTLRHLALLLAGTAASLGVLGYWGEHFPLPVLAVAVTVTLLTGGSLLGAAVGGRIEHPGHLLVVVIVSLLVDTFSVFHHAGPTAALVRRPTLIALLALPWPQWGTTSFSPILGLGDVVFAALYAAAARRFALGLWRTRVALVVGLVGTMVAVLLLLRPVPALVGMGVAMLVVHPRARRLPPQDRRRAWLCCGLLLVVWLASWFWR